MEMLFGITMLRSGFRQFSAVNLDNEITSPPGF